tara:strand:+ start:488 stop:1837 length:1350 start_codon:yes stop_codon:yes gene_type:complete
MADYGLTVNSSVYSGKEFQVYIGADYGDGTNDVGTINSSSNGSSMYRLDIEGMTLPTFSPNQEFEMRSGAGRVAEFGAVFSSSKRTTTEISLSGRVTMQDLPIFMENILSQAASAENNLFEVATGYNPTTFKHDDATGATVFNKTLTIHFVATTAADSYTLPGCVCTSLSLSADMTSASGRYTYSATFQTSYIPTKGADSMTSANELTTTLGATNVFLSDQSTKDMNIMDVNSDVVFASGNSGSGSSTSVTVSSTALLQPGMKVTGTNIGTNAAVASISSATVFVATVANSGTVSGALTFVSDYTSINPIINNFTINIESPTQFLGAQGTNAEPEVFARAVPELTITISGSVKYDTETDKLLEAFRDSAQTSYLQLVLNNRAITSNLETLGSIAIAAHADQTFGIIIPKAKLTSAEVSSDDVAAVNFEAKVLDPGSNEIIIIATGATAS